MIFTCRKRDRVTGGTEIVVETLLDDGVIKSIAFPVRKLEEKRLKDIISEFFDIEKELIVIL